MSDFEARTERVIEEAVADVVACGIATVEKGNGRVRIVPVNPRAAEMNIYLDYPTIAIGAEGHTTETFGSEEERLSAVREYIRAVIDGRFEWRYVRTKWRFLIWTIVGPWKLEGKFETESGPQRFNRYGIGGEPDGPLSGTYEPYAGSR